MVDHGDLPREALPLRMGAGHRPLRSLPCAPDATPLGGPAGPDAAVRSSPERRALVEPGMRRSLAAMSPAVMLSSAAVATAYGATNAHRRVVACTGDPTVAHKLTIRVAGESTFGYYAVPRHRARGIVVFDHGYSHTAWNWRQHLSQVAARDGVIAVAMDYRKQTDSAVDPKTGFSSSRGWRVQEGADDSIAAAKFFDSSCKTGGVNTVY